MDEESVLATVMSLTGTVAFKSPVPVFPAKSLYVPARAWAWSGFSFHNPVSTMTAGHVQQLLRELVNSILLALALVVRAATGATFSLKPLHVLCMQETNEQCWNDMYGMAGTPGNWRVLS